MAHELNVRVLLTGRVLQRGDTLNVQAELIDAAANSQVWGQKYSRTLSDMCAVEEQIAREIADTLRVKLNRADKTRLAHRATQDGEAYQLYLRGRYLWNRRTRDALGRAIGVPPAGDRPGPSLRAGLCGFGGLLRRARHLHVRSTR